ncbi:MAG: hypothetical protein KAI18_04380 [Candidatus Aenigmarchaeota archaeon]|nr:hypothetical protein [Candidatus Aenigmarchaeota archaeon]
MVYEIIEPIGSVHLGTDGNIHFGKQVISDSEYGGSIVSMPFSVSKDELINFCELGPIDKYLGLDVRGTIYGVVIRKTMSGGISFNASYELFTPKQTKSVLSKSEVEQLVRLCKSNN